MRQHVLCASIFVAGVLACVSFSQAEIFRGIEFPNGALSFADEVIRYVPSYGGGPVPTEPTAIDPMSALGIPDYPPGGSVGSKGAVSLGRGGLLELKFVDNYLVNSGDSTHDLHIFEVGPDIEDTYVSIRPTPETALILGASYDADGDGFYEIGKIRGSTYSIDIDSIFLGYAANTLVFDAVQLIDDYYQGGTSGSTVGADIDAVGAIGSIRSCDFEIVGDLNRDCKVNLEDFVLLARNWLLDCKLSPGDPDCIPLP